MGRMTISLDQLRDDFAFLDDWEDRYRYIIELGKDLPPLEQTQKTELTKVQGCASQVWLVASVGPGPDPEIRFAGESDAHIVRGLVAIVLAIYSGRKASVIAGLDAMAVLKELGLEAHLSPQRANGLRAMVKRIQDHGTKALSEQAGQS